MIYLTSKSLFCILIKNQIVIYLAKLFPQLGFALRPYDVHLCFYGTTFKVHEENVCLQVNRLIVISSSEAEISSSQSVFSLDIRPFLHGGEIKKRNVILPKAGKNCRSAVRRGEVSHSVRL